MRAYPSAPLPVRSPHPYWLGKRRSLRDATRIGPDSTNSQGPAYRRLLHFMQRLSKQTGVAGADHCGEKGFHLSETIGQLRSKGPIIVVEPPITFLPSIRLLTMELFAKRLTNQRMRIQLSGIMRILSGEEFRSS